MSFSLSKEPILAARESAASSVGGVVIFEGVVRNHNDGREVKSLEYEAMDSLACKEGNRILDEACGRFPIESANCVHRVGHLQVGDIAIQVVVTSAHRGEAFDACRFIVDEVKSRVPIWKKEHYADGSAEWINAATKEA